MCRIVCILIGAASGAAAWYFLQELVATLPLILISFFTFFATAWFLYEGFCGEESGTHGKASAAGGAAVAKMGATDRDAWTSEEMAASSSAPASFVSSTETAPAKAAKPAPKKTVKTAAKSTASKSKSAPAKAKASKPAAAKKAAPKKKPAAKAAGPERLSKPKGKADDLKLIAGVGPKLEKTLNGLGFWHFAQIAKWKKADVAIVDDELSFKGRIERDDWIKQAKALAKGGEAEYIKVFGKKPR